MHQSPVRNKQTRDLITNWIFRVDLVIKDSVPREMLTVFAMSEPKIAY
jgi:hypothetical protein